MLFYLAPCGIGLGHAARLLTVAKRLKELGHEVVFSSYSEAVHFIRKSGFKCAMEPPIKYEIKEDGSFDFKRTLAKGVPTVFNFLQHLSGEFKIMSDYKPDVVISDSRLSSVVAAKLHKKPSLLIVNQIKLIIPHRRSLSRGLTGIKEFAERAGQEIFSFFWNFSDVILVPDFPPPYTISKFNLEVPRRSVYKVKFIGPIVGVRRDDLPSKEEIREKFEFDADKPLVYVAINGTVREKVALSKKIEPMLRKITDEFQVVLTRGLTSNLLPEVRSKGFKVYNWSPYRYEFLKAADVLISNCGHTTLAEAIYFGVPVLMIPTPYHTERVSNAKSLAEKQVGVLLPQEKMNVFTLRSALKRIVYTPVYQVNMMKMREYAERIDAVGTVINYGLQMAEEYGG